jgi:hypothetical protein
LGRKEKIEASSATPNAIAGLHQLVVGIITALAFAVVFVLPRQLKVFWVLITGLTILMHLGIMIYVELMRLSGTDTEKKKYAEYGFVLLFSLMCVYTSVMLGILLFMAWSLYSIANSKTNIMRNDRAVVESQTQSSGPPRPTPPSARSRR